LDVPVDVARPGEPTLTPDPKVDSVDEEYPETHGDDYGDKTVDPPG
jgi:hypothetical protein